MSRLADALTARRPEWGPLPDDLVRALDWMEQQGWSAEVDGVVHATPYPGDRQLGVVFRSDLTTDGWYDGEAADALLPVAETNGSGGLAALWRAPDGAVPVVLVDDLDQLVLARSVVDFLRLVAVGHDELRTWSVGDEPPTESARAHDEFRSWVSSSFAVEVPEVWDALGADEFTDWSDRQRGVPAGPASTTENPDRAAGTTTVTGAVVALLGLLGAEDGPEAVATIADLTGPSMGESLRSSTRALKKSGLEVSVQRGRVATIWLHLGTPRSIGFGIAPTVSPLWVGPTLVDGLSAESTPADARELLGEPEREGEGHLRYRVGDRYLHLGFGATDRLAQITLMVEVP